MEIGNILCVGRISKEKGFQFVIQAMKKIRQEFPSARLHICGIGPYLNYLKQLSRDLGLDDAIVFHGYVNPSNLAVFYEKANVVVFPSTCLEICGLVNLETLAYARPLIVSSQCGVNELFNGTKSVILANPTNTQDLAEKILKILTDWDLFKEMSKNAFDLYNNRFCPEIHYRNLIIIYEELIRGRK